MAKLLRNLKKITRLNFQHLSAVIGQKSIFRHYCQFVSIRVKRKLRISQDQFLEKLRKLKLR